MTRSSSGQISLAEQSESRYRRPKQSAAPSLSQLVSKIDTVSSLPEVMTRILGVVNDDSASVADLKDVVEGDPSLTSRVLRTVNSAAYGLRNRVESIHQAIGFLGFREVRNLAVTGSVAEIFREEMVIGRYHRRGLWKHLISTAVVGRMVALRCGLPNFDEVFMGGLLHDLGIILLDQHLHEEFVNVVTEVKDDDVHYLVEREMLGFDHMQFGALVAESWKLPPSTVAVIRFHHESEKAPKEHQKVVFCVQVADFLCHKKEIASIPDGARIAPSGEVFSAIGLGREDVTVVWQDIEPELERHRMLMEI
ncbi:HDOD domain protein [Planctomycetes bacterium Pan216]|uniref:HDOD domain protein n=1 Tax=Kolteria novifilia TaxID=2527975 RepID=A0A518B851_9BACT|nr:HDOD domain protein [Planctomycetes bacterium Pan216]